MTYSCCMSWIFLAAGAQFINAVVAVLDKYIVSDEKALPRPFVYAFYSCLLTGFWGAVYFVGLIPGLAELGVPQFSNIEKPSIQVVGMSFLAAYTIFIALVSLYDALKKADASDVIPVIGAVSAISTFGMSFFFLDVEVSKNFIWGIVLLSVGTLLVSQGRFQINTAFTAVHSGLFFGLHFITMKGLFQETSFDDGFFWSRVGLVVFTATLLLVPVYFSKITGQSKQTSKKTSLIIISTKILAGIASFMILKATDIGDVAVVQALDGLKFVFVLVIGVFVGHFIPKSAGENESDLRTILRKALYVAIISAGFVILFT